MRFTSAAALAAAAAPLAVSAKGQFGFALGCRHTDASCKNQDDFTSELIKLKDAGATVVRTYAGVDGGANEIGGPVCYVPKAILGAAKTAGVQILLGVWADTQDAFEKDMKETLSAAKNYQAQVYGFTVGSEGLYRDEQKAGTGYKAEYLLDRINEFKKEMKGTYSINKKVGTADSWSKYQDGTADPLITGGVDLLLVNAFGYWQAQKITNATATYLDDLQQAYGHIQSVAGSTTSIELWNGETGWPTDGGTDYTDPKFSHDTAVASTKNAQTFFSEGVCAALDWDFNVFYFEAFDEAWKPASKGLNGREGDETHWGAFNGAGQPVVKNLDCKYKS